MKKSIAKNIEYMLWYILSSRKYDVGEYEPLAQLVEHLTFNQRVEGSSPSWLTIFNEYAGVAELADALDLGSSAFGVGVRLPSPALLIK